MSENLNQWFEIQQGGELRLSVKSKSESDNAFIVTSRLLPTIGEERIWVDSEINPGPKIQHFDDGVSYSVRVAVKFFSEENQTAVIECEAFDATGAAIADWWGNTVYRHEVVGKQGQNPKRATLLFIQS